ncbi:MAG: GatB/YqeY domain-containing protein [Rhizobacter sp.]|nr:GatB/YqeY domain-containing protein [Chlorobiales bacterium]
MTLKERINEDLKAAMKSGNKPRLETIRAIKKEIIEKETAEKRTSRGDLAPEEELEVLMSMAKRRRDSIEQFNAAARADLAEIEANDLKVLEEYLPAQMSEADVEAAVVRVIAQTGSASAKDAGKVMGMLMKELKGKADGTLVQKLVKEKLP